MLKSDLLGAILSTSGSWWPDGSQDASGSSFWNISRSLWPDGSQDVSEAHCKHFWTWWPDCFQAHCGSSFCASMGLLMVEWVEVLDFIFEVDAGVIFLYEAKNFGDFHSDSQYITQIFM